MFKNRRIYTMKYMREEKQAFMDCVRRNITLKYLESHCPKT
jgi:hypothetical protein